jgi:hypothetical protein
MKRALVAAAAAGPTDASDEPKEEDWASATDLGPAELDKNKWVTRPQCTQRAIREWVRVICTPTFDGDEDWFFGAVWGFAGETKPVKASFVPASNVGLFQKAPTSPIEELTRKMGASATVTFPIRPGTAVVLGIDQLGWDHHYDGGSNVMTSPGILVDASWAAGEKKPTILYR